MKSEIRFLGFIDDAKWPHYLWSVMITSEDGKRFERFDYKTGIGHARPTHVKGKGSNQTIWESERPNKRPLEPCVLCKGAKTWAIIPKIDDIMECLFSDADAGSMSFKEFCDNFGYSDDSLLALDVYRACMDNDARLRKVLGTEFTELQKLNEQKRAG